MTRPRNSMRPWRCLAVAAAIAAAGGSEAAENRIKPTGEGRAYYVSPDGSDKNDGLSLDSPFKTVLQADRLLERAGPAKAGGSVVYLMPGIYLSEQAGPFKSVCMRADGREGFPITITSYDAKRRAILDGGGDPGKGVDGGCCFMLDVANFVTVCDIEIRNGSSGLVGNGTKACIFERLEVHGIRADGGDNPCGIKLIGSPYGCTIRNNFVYDVRPSKGVEQNASGIILFGGNGCVIHNNEVRDCGGGIRYKHHSTRQNPGDEFRTLVFRNLVRGFKSGGIMLATDKAHAFENAVVGGPTGFCTDYGDGAPYVNNRIYHNTVAEVGIGFFSDPNVESRETVFRDNIVVASDNMLYVKGWVTLKTSDWNLYSKDLFRTPDSNPGTLAELRAKGHDGRSLVGEPGFVNPPGDVRIGKESPARGKSSEGQDIGAWRSDSPGYAIGLLKEAKAGEDITPPDVRLTSPEDGATVSGVVEVVASATDAVGVASVQLMAGAEKLGEAMAAPPYSARWDASQRAPGSYALTAIARDAAGNVMTSMAAIVKVQRRQPAGTTKDAGP